MCGIIGYSGIDKAMPKIIHGLERLEYRGYDSAGTAFFKNGRLVCVKTKGRIENLKETLGDLYDEADIKCGIGHTRWATHGEPSDVNSHPHGTENVLIVHNGIIENYGGIKDFLLEKGYTFDSETDTETAAKLLDYFYGETKDPVEAIKKVKNMLRGSFAICAVFCGNENKIYGFRKDNPLIVAPADNGIFFASDVSAVLMHTKHFRRLEEDEIAVIDEKTIFVTDKNGETTESEFETVDWDSEAAEKGGFQHFMLKEIFEEPEAVKRTVQSLVCDGLPCLGFENISDVKRIHIVACGTAMHAGLMGKIAIEKFARIPVSVVLASEFRYQDPILDKKDLVIVISQSGETADTLAALRLAKNNGIPTLGVVNVIGSTIAREAERVIYTHAGPEIAVASTKAYSVQLAVMFLVAIEMGYVSGMISEKTAKEYTEELLVRIPRLIENTLQKKEQCSEIAWKYKACKNMFFMGRGADYALACEAALKTKEISYIHCESIAAGEMKHGTISLITDDIPVFVFATDEELVEKTISNIKEVSARGARIIMICGENTDIKDDCEWDVIRIPETDSIFKTMFAATTAQLVAYFISCHLGLDVDKPRNLAKSVTVE